MNKEPFDIKIIKSALKKRLNWERIDNKDSITYRTKYNKSLTISITKNINTHLLTLVIDTSKDTFGYGTGKDDKLVYLLYQRLYLVASLDANLKLRQKRLQKEAQSNKINNIH